MGKDAVSSSDGTSNTSRFGDCLVAGFTVLFRTVDAVVRAADGLAIASGIVPGVVARDVFFDDVFDRCSRCPLPLACLWPAVLCAALACEVVLADRILPWASFSCVGLCGLICSCNALALISSVFAIADFVGRVAGIDARSATPDAFFAILTRGAPSVLLRWTTGRFAGGVDGTLNSSSEGTSKTSGLAVAARACACGRADFASPPDPAGGALESAECLCDRSGEGASSSRRLVRGGGRRDNLPYVMTFFRLSPVVKVDDMKDAIADAFFAVVVIQKLF